jgi:alpha-mannosidase
LATSIQPTVLTNGLVTLKFNEVTGDISELSAANGPNLIDNKDTLGFNAYWYGGLIKSNLQKQGKATFEVIEHGPVLSKIRITTPAPGAESLVREVQLNKGSNEIFLTNIVDKKRVVADENVRFAFPFNISNSQVRIDVPWATVRPEQDQLKGANKNFFSVQRWVDVSNEETGVTLAPIEAPLLEIGDMYGQNWMTDMKTRPWIRKYEPSNRLFSWVMNNAWFVNYKAYQEGPIPFHYVLRPHGKFNHSEAKKFGMEQTQPLLVVAVKEDAGEVVPVLNFAKGESITVTSMKRSKDGKAIIIRLFNASDSAAQDEILWKKIKPVSVHQSSANEERGTTVNGSISLAPWEVMTIRAELK